MLLAILCWGADWDGRRPGVCLRGRAVCGTLSLGSLYREPHLLPNGRGHVVKPGVADLQVHTLGLQLAPDLGILSEHDVLQVLLERAAFLRDVALRRREQLQPLAGLRPHLPQFGVDALRAPGFAAVLDE